MHSEEDVRTWKQAHDQAPKSVHRKTQNQTKTPKPHTQQSRHVFSVSCGSTCETTRVYLRRQTRAETASGAGPSQGPRPSPRHSAGPGGSRCLLRGHLAVTGGEGFPVGFLWGPDVMASGDKDPEVSGSEVFLALPAGLSALLSQTASLWAERRVLPLRTPGQVHRHAAGLLRCVVFESDPLALGGSPVPSKASPAPQPHRPHPGTLA